jgi:N-acetylglucosaminyldiphosphoundecaprenol N-acetyl-beta-D-mannosaminyltransferase
MGKTIQLTDPPIVSEQSGEITGLAHLQIPIVPAAVRQLFGIPVHAATMRQVRDICLQSIQQPQRLIIGVINAAKIVNMHRSPRLGEAVLQSDLILADGMAVVWASRILGRPLPERVAGIDLFKELLDLANERSLSVYLFGATQEVLDLVVKYVSGQFPNARIVGHRNGYFDDSDDALIAQEIRDARPSMLFLGITSPRKEMFLARWAGFMDVSVCHGVGGSFDVLAGKVRRAPEMCQRMGLEWLYRVLQEPRRLWRRYLVTNTIFIGMVFREFLRPSQLINAQKWRGAKAEIPGNQ